MSPFKRCAFCGDEIVGRRSIAKYCASHATKEARGIGTARIAGVNAPVLVDGVECCIDCGSPVNGYRSVVPSQGGRCDRCVGAARVLNDKAAHKATRAVYRAVSRGVLPRPETCACADCGKPARVYDHRDYSRPLAVEPVCSQCNSKRGESVRPDPALYAARSRQLNRIEVLMRQVRDAVGPISWGEANRPAPPRSAAAA